MIDFQWNNSKFSLIQFGMGVFTKDMVGHSHSKNSYELHYIIGGKGDLTTETDTFELSKGDFFVTGPNIYHKQSTDIHNPLKEIFIYLQTHEEKSKDLLVSSFLLTHFFFSNEPDLQTYFESVLNESDESKFGYQSAVSAALQLLLTHISRVYVPQLNGSSSINQNLNDQRFVIIDKAFIYRADTITLSELATEIGLCERQTQRLLHKYYGKSFKEKKKECLGNLHK